MGISADDLLAYSKKLLETTEEIHFRAAAGRAFYACFHKCLPLVKHLGPIEFANEGAHQRVIRVFGEYKRDDPNDCTGKMVRFVGGRYFNARKLRGEADYDIGKPFTKSDAEELVGIAGEIWEKLDAIKKEFPQVA